MNVKYFDINSNGHSIKTKLFCDSVREIEHIVLYVHGFGGHKDNKATEYFAQAYLSKKKKCAVCIFDLPCHGTDVKKKLSLSDCDLYIETVIDYIKTQLHVDDICAYGTSFGGYLILKYIHEHDINPFRRIVLRCPAVAMFEAMSEGIMTEENIELLNRGRDVYAGFDRKVLIDLNFLQELSLFDVRKWEYFDYADDILIVHGTKDEIIPIEESRAFADNNIIEFIEIENADHRFQDLNSMKLAHSYMIDFVL